MPSKKIIFALILIGIILLIGGFFVVKKIYFTNEPVSKSISTGTSADSSTSASQSNSGSNQVNFVPLNASEREKVNEVITTSNFTKAIPEKNPISLRFFYFENGRRIWQDSFLIADGKILQSGKPGIYLTLHSKYIEKIDELGLCETIKLANENGDLGFESEYRTTSLFMKYSGMLKYRDCIGF